VATCVCVGTVKEARKTGWAFDGRLATLDKNWKGVLLLFLVIFYGSVRPLVLWVGSRWKWKTPLG